MHKMDLGEWCFIIFVESLLERLFISRYYPKYIFEKNIKQVLFKMFIVWCKGWKVGNPPNFTTIFFVTRKKNNLLAEPEEIENTCIW